MKDESQTVLFLCTNTDPVLATKTIDTLQFVNMKGMIVMLAYKLLRLDLTVKMIGY